MDMERYTWALGETSVCARVEYRYHVFCGPHGLELRRIAEDWESPTVAAEPGCVPDGWRRESGELNLM